MRHLLLLSLCFESCFGQCSFEWFSLEACVGSFVRLPGFITHCDNCANVWPADTPCSNQRYAEQNTKRLADNWDSGDCGAEGFERLQHDWPLIELVR